MNNFDGGINCVILPDTELRMSRGVEGLSVIIQDKRAKAIEAERARAFRVNQALSKTAKLLMMRIGEFEDFEGKAIDLTDGEKTEYATLRRIRDSQDIVVGDWNALMKALWGV